MKALDRMLAEDPLFAEEVEKLIEHMRLEQDVAGRLEMLLNFDLGSGEGAYVPPALPRFNRARTRQ